MKNPIEVTRIVLYCIRMILVVFVLYSFVIREELTTVKDFFEKCQSVSFMEIIKGRRGIVVL